MPELPEVQTVVNYLNKHIIGEQIIDINFFIPKILKNLTVPEFKKKLINVKFNKVERRGKYLILTLDNNMSLIVHLRMEGKFQIKFQNEQYVLDKKHLVCEFVCKNFNICFYDTRRFATFNLINTNQLDDFFKAKINLDPLNNLVNSDFLYNQISNLKTCIKNCLLNQKIISGIGNIYADEILFAVKIDPYRKANKITYNECKNIINASKEILTKSISLNGTTINTYKFDGLHSGGYQEYLMVHSNKIKKCKLCNNDIIFSKINGRGTYWCKKCQK